MPSDTLAAGPRHVPAPDPGGLGLILPTFPQQRAELPSASALADLCRRAEAGGAEALWVCDHIFWHGPALEALSSLGVAVAATQRATIGTCILQLPLRHAPTVAKEAAALAHLSGGRLVLGVGVGAHPGEYAAAGVPFAGRGRALDQGIDTLRRAWSASPDQRYVQLPSPHRVPVWVGGSSEAALRRAGRRGDGWIPLFVSPGEYGPAMGRLDKEAERAGRDPRVVARAAVVFVSVGGSDAEDRGLAWMASLYGLAARSFVRHLVAGSARSCADSIARFTEAGARHVAVFVTSDDPLVQFEDLAGEYAGLVASSASPRRRRPGSIEPVWLTAHHGSPDTTRRAVRVGQGASTPGTTPVQDQVWR